MKTVNLYLQHKRKGNSWVFEGLVDMGQLCNDLETISKKKQEGKLATHILQLAFSGFTGMERLQS